MIAESSNLSDYLNMTEIIDYDHKSIVEKCLELSEKSVSDIEIIESVYKFVRDSIMHSGDINAEKVTTKASEVLINRHGICHAKSGANIMAEAI